jgi:hypothetical protein
MTHRSSRSWKASMFSSATSERRRPQPSRMAMMARSRLPRIVPTLGACRSSVAYSALSQLPSLTPIRFAPLTRLMPAANSGLSGPVSAALYASRRTAARRRLTVEEDSRRDFSSSRYRRTTVLLNASRGSEQYHATKSSIANRYECFDSDDRRLCRRRSSRNQDPGGAGHASASVKQWASSRVHSDERARRLLVNEPQEAISSPWSSKRTRPVRCFR